MRTRPRGSVMLARLLALLLVCITGAFSWGQSPEPESPAAPTRTPAEKLLTREEAQKIIDDAIREHEAKKAKKDAPKEAGNDAGYLVGSDLKMKATWKDGVIFETPNRDFWFHFGAIGQYDAAWYQANDQVMFGTRGTGPLNDAVNLRSFRLRYESGFYEVLEMMAEFEFANGFATGIPITPLNTFNTVGPTDLWLQFNQLPWIGHVRIGNQKEWFSLEHLNSFRFLEFMERSLLFDTFVPTPFSNGFTPGISVFNTFLNDRMFYGVGVYKNERDLFGFGVEDGAYAVTGRLAGLAIHENEGQRLLHLGVAGSYRDPVQDEVLLRTRMEIRNAPFPLLPIIADTGLIRAESHALTNFEAAAVLGPLTFQAEYTNSFLNSARQQDRNLGTVFFQGWYAQVTYFLTGESRPYNSKWFCFDRVIPNEPFFFIAEDGRILRGKGAWELAARYTSLDLSNAGVEGGVLQNVTLGVNWYLNPNSKLQWNYDFTHRGSVGGDATGNIHAFGMRMAFDF